MDFAPLFRFVAPTARKALSVGAKEAVVEPHPKIRGVYRVTLRYYFAKRPTRRKDERGDRTRKPGPLGH